MSLKMSPRTENKYRIFTWESLLTLGSQRVSVLMGMLAQLLTSRSSSGVMVPVQTGIPKDSKFSSTYLPITGPWYLTNEAIHQYFPVESAYLWWRMASVQVFLKWIEFYISCFSLIHISTMIRHINYWKEELIKIWLLNKDSIQAMSLDHFDHRGVLLSCPSLQSSSEIINMKAYHITKRSTRFLIITFNA